MLLHGLTTGTSCGRMAIIYMLSNPGAMVLTSDGDLRDFLRLRALELAAAVGCLVSSLYSFKTRTE